MNPTKIITLLVGAVQAVDKIWSIFHTDVPDKNKARQDAAVDAIGAMISALEISAGKEIMDEAKFQELLRKLIDDYIAVQNFIRDFKK